MLPRAIEITEGACVGAQQTLILTKRISSNFMEKRLEGPRREAERPVRTQLFSVRAYPLTQ